MKYLHQKQSFLEILNLQEDKIPECLILVGASDSDVALAYLIRTIKPKRIKKTGLPNILTGVVDGKFIAFGITYATSLTADIVHAFCAVGVKRVAFFGFGGSIKHSLVRGDVVRPSEVIDLVGINSAYFNPTVLEGDYVVATWHNLYSESEQFVREWRRKKIDVVDLETSAVVSVCLKFRIKPFVQLIVADRLFEKEELNEIYKVSFSILKRKQQKLIKDYLKNNLNMKE